MKIYLIINNKRFGICVNISLLLITLINFHVFSVKGFTRDPNDFFLECCCIRLFNENIRICT